MPGVFGNKKKEKAKLIDSLEEIFEVSSYFENSKSLERY